MGTSRKSGAYRAQMEKVSLEAVWRETPDAGKVALVAIGIARMLAAQAKNSGGGTPGDGGEETGRPA